MNSKFTKNLLLSIVLALILQISAVLLIQTWAQSYLADAAASGTYSTASLIVSTITFAVQDAIILAMAAWLIIKGSRAEQASLVSS